MKSCTILKSFLQKTRYTIYREIYEKGLGDVVSAVYIYSSAHKQLRRHLQNPFRDFPLYINN